MQIILYFLITITLILLNNPIAKKLNLYDEPDHLRKFHLEKIPLTGGIIIFALFSFFVIYDFVQYKFFQKELITNFSENYTLFLGGLFFFVIGLLDDKKNLGANFKIFIFLIFLIIIVLLDKNILIEKVNLSFLSKEFSIDAFSYFWTIICFLLFINAFNMFDGINLQVGFYSLFNLIYIFLFYSYFDQLIVALLISLLGFLYLNYKSKSFLGNSGTYFISFVLGYIFIKIYNLEKNIFADEIVLLMIIPGLDLMRLFITRIIKKKHPFSPDREHLHHYMVKKFNKIAFLYIILIIWIPVVFAKLTNMFMFTIIFQFILYLYLIFLFKKN